MSVFFAVFAFGLIVFLAEKTIAALHFGTRKWTRWLWVLLSVGLCPSFLLPVFWAETGHLRELALVVAAIFFSIIFLEDGEPWDALFPFVVAAGQLFLGEKIPVFEWVLLAAVGLFFLKKKRPFPIINFSEISPIWIVLALFFAQYFSFGISLKNWDWHRISPLLLPFWPIFSLFMPICLFFLKKTDRTPLPKKWLAVATVASVLAAVFWPFTREVGLQLAWFGMVVLAFPVFERGLLYGLVFVKKWKIWAIVAAFALIQIGVILYFF